MRTPQESTELTPNTTHKIAKADQVIDYISQMLTELSEMAVDVGHLELAELIRFSARAARMEKSIGYE